MRSIRLISKLESRDDECIVIVADPHSVARFQARSFMCSLPKIRPLPGLKSSRWLKNLHIAFLPFHFGATQVPALKKVRN